MCIQFCTPLLAGPQAHKKERDRNIFHFILSHVLANPQADVQTETAIRNLL